jgi:capsule synthesis protein PGA_cap
MLVNKRIAVLFLLLLSIFIVVRVASSSLLSVANAGTPTGGSVVAMTPLETKSRIDTISISIVGDLMLGSNYPSNIYLPSPEEGNILQYAMPFLRTTDMRIGNLECAVSDTVRVFKECGTSSQCYAFRCPFRIAQWYKDAGFDYLNLANNHSFDFGMPGAESTLRFLMRNNIRTSGVLQHPWDTLTIKHTRFGFVSFAPHNNCLDLNEDSLVNASISSLRPMCDVLIVFFHGGGEGAARKHTPYNHEIFLEQDRGDVRHFAHECVNAGADLVIGSGPHVVRGMETYKQKLIAYSLGNFATYHLFNLKPPLNQAPILQVRITGKGVLVSNKILSFIQQGEGIPMPDSAAMAYEMIRSLSIEDFKFNEVGMASTVLK